MKRAGLDYWDYVDINIYKGFDEYLTTFSQHRIIGTSKSGDIPLPKVQFKNKDILLFGREDIGLPVNIRESCDLITKIPMEGLACEDGSGGVRSLNLAVSCGIVCYQAITMKNEE